MNFKANYEIVTLSTGDNLFPLSGNTSAIHQVYCIAPGSVTIGAAGGGLATFSLTANDKVDVLTRSVNVAGGTFIGFRAKNDSQPYI